ncbi:MAG: hypothetical protein JWM32_251 [Verrucomicrobia bacterium]|nr:hypothetical protein [Verrucomicrobiota bacterium]
MPPFRLLRFAPVFAVVLGAIGLVSAARAQIALTKVTTASVADGTLSPGDTLTVNFQLATGSSPAVKVEFAFNEGLVASTNVPSAGVATGSITNATTNGVYTLQFIRVYDAYGRMISSASYGIDTINYASGGEYLMGPPVLGVVAASGSTPDYATTKFTVSNSPAAFNQSPRLSAVARTSGSILSAGSPIVFQATAAPTSSPIVRGTIRLKRGEEDDVVTNFVWNSGTITIPTTTDWVNGDYHIASLFVWDQVQEGFYQHDDGSNLLTDAQNFRLSGGAANAVYPVLTNLTATGGTSLSAGQARGLNFTATSGNNPLSSIIAEYQDATGFIVNRSITNTNAGTITFTTAGDWVNGPYVLKTVTLTDTAGRQTIYSRNQGWVNAPGGSGGTHTFDFSTLDFSVTSGIASPPYFGTQPKDATVNPLQDALLFCSVVSPPGYPLTYQWYIGHTGDTSKPTGTNDSRFRATQLSSTTSFWVRATTLAGSVDSVTATVTMNYPSNIPKIYAMPLATSQHVGAKVFAEVYAIGPAPLSYQWYKDGSPVAGATLSRITFEHIALSDNATYTVTITNSFGSVTSEPVKLTATDLPAITTQPVAKTVNYGDSVTFTVAATGGNLEYLWRINDTFFPNAVGSYTPTFTIPSVDGSHAGLVTVYVHNVEGNVTSIPVALTVVGGPKPMFDLNSTAYGTIGFPLTLPVSVTPNVTLLTATGLPAGLALNASNEIQGTPTIAGTYAVTLSATNAGGTTTFPLTLIITSGPFPPIFTLQPVSQTVALHGDISFTAAATGTTGITRYQWNFNGQPILDGHYGTYTVYDASLADAGDYAMDATAVLGTTRSNVAHLTIDTAHSAPYLIGDQSLYLVNILASAGDTVTLGANVGGTPPLTYQWVKAFADLPGANRVTLAVTDIPPAGTPRLYELKVSNAYGSKKFSMGSVTRSDAPKISPATQSITAGQNATLTVTSPLPGSTYQWYRGTVGDSSQRIEGATSASLTVTNLQASTNYWVVIKPTANVYAMGAEVIVTGNASGITISSQPPSQSVIVGGAASFSVTASGSSSLTYQWRRNGSPIAGQTGSTLTLNGVALSDSGETFDVVVTSTTGSVTSSSATLTVTSLPSAAGEEVFFGSISGGGQFALYDRGNGAGVIIGTLPAGRGSFVAAFTITSDGSFSVSLPTASAGTALPAKTGGSPIKGSATLTLSGQISGGLMSGAIASTGDAFSASIQSSGSTAAIAGFYAAPLLNSTSGSVLYFIVGTSGVVMGGTVTGSTTQVATGTIAGGGQFNLSFGSGNAVAGTINAGTGGITGQVTTNGGVSGSIGGLSAGVVRTDRLVNLSTRGLVGDGEKAMFAGFVISGAQPKSVLIRATGPTLADYGLAGIVDNPVLKIFRGTTEILGNDDWETFSDVAQLSSTVTRVGAFAQKAGSKDAALTATLAPGVYSAQVTRAAGSSIGVALVEIYDAAVSPGSEEQKVINISTRGEVGTGERMMFAGFVVSGNSPKKVLIRAVGPTLANYGVGNLLLNPQVKLYQGDTVVATNDNWEDAGNAGVISTAAAQVGGFPLVPGSKDAALLLTLAPGLYSAQVSGVDATTGIVLLEVYEVP